MFLYKTEFKAVGHVCFCHVYSIADSIAYFKLYYVKQSFVGINGFLQYFNLMFQRQSEDSNISTYFFFFLTYFPSSMICFELMFMSLKRFI
jgi:hypothetical protein